MMAARTSGPLCFWCSTGASDAYRRALAARGANAVPVFNLDFYGLVHEPGGVAEHWDWIYRLALEYQNALRQVVGRWPGQPVRVRSEARRVGKGCGVPCRLRWSASQ